MNLTPDSIFISAHSANVVGLVDSLIQKELPKKIYPQIIRINTFVQVFWTSLNSNTYRTKYQLPGDRTCWSSKTS